VSRTRVDVSNPRPVTSSARRANSPAAADRDDAAISRQARVVLLASEDTSQINQRRSASAHSIADGEWTRTEEILERIPPGQPILTDPTPNGGIGVTSGIVDRAIRRPIGAQAKAEHYGRRAAAAAQRVGAAEVERTVVGPTAIRPATRRGRWLPRSVCPVGDEVTA
jgi:hypothetical protein